MITITQKGDFSNTEKFLQRMKELVHLSDLDKYGQVGVQALADATPKDTGKTAASWGYEIKHTKTGAVIDWTNSNINDGVPIAIIIQYGHGTGWGTYVEGVDYVNPAMKPVFDKISEDIWREVTRS